MLRLLPYHLHRHLAAFAIMATFGSWASATPRHAVATAARLAIAVTGLPVGVAGNITVSGPHGFSQHVDATRTLNDLASGSYTVRAFAVSGNGITYSPALDSQLVTLAADSVADIEVAYAPPLLSGGLTITVSGLPSGTNANVMLTSLAGVARAIAGTQTIRSLIPGAYAVSAAYVVNAGGTYAPAKVTQVVNVVAGAIATAEVSYAIAPPASFGTITPGFQPRSITFNGSTHQYQLFVPRGYTPTIAWPVILFGHGGAEGGANNTAQLGVGLGPYLRANAATFPAIVVFPQKAAGQSALEFDSMMVIMLDATMREAHVDSARQYLTGVSAGGARAWSIAYHHPDRFAALAPISALLTPIEFGVATQSPAITMVATTLRTMPIRQYNGTNDTQVRIVTYAYPVREAFAAVGAPNYTFHEIVGGTHASTWDTTYADPEFWRWLFAQHR